jgi:dihydrofolate reductase
MMAVQSASVGGRRVFWQMMVSLDGRTAGPNGELDWHVVDDAFNAYVLEMLDSIDTILMGRRTWEDLAGYWPNATSPEAPRMNALEKVVFSSTLDEAPWSNSRVVREAAATELARLKAAPGRDLAVFGSGQLAAGLLPTGLIDEARLVLCPVVLGAGPALLEGIPERMGFRLDESRTLPSGVVILRYSAT